MKLSVRHIISIALCIFQGNLNGQTIVEQGKSKLYHIDDVTGKLVYSKDVKGNRLPDFSHVGYHSSEKEIPYIPVVIALGPSPGDDTQRIQDALDKLGALPLDHQGFRGTLLLKRGFYHVKGTISIHDSGIVLRGEGDGPNGTVIIATGYGHQKYKRTLIVVGPRSDMFDAHTDDRYTTAQAQIQLLKRSKREIVDAYVPVGSVSFEVRSASGYSPGDRVIVHRPSTASWIHSIGCDQLEPRWAEVRDARWVRDGRAPGFYYQSFGYDHQYSILQKKGESWDEFKKRVPLTEDGRKLDFTRQWEPGTYDFFFERRITEIEGNHVTIDIPIVHPLDTVFGGGAIYHYEAPGRIAEVGIENLRLVSEFADPIPDYPYGDPEKKEEAETHAWNAILLKTNTENTWVRNVTGNYFGWSLVSASGKRATIQDCVSLGHASKITGGRRYPFMIDGQLNLVQRCLTYEGRHEFVTQARTAGPNVFVDCLGIDSKNTVGPHHRYSIGTLFDNVKSEKPMISKFNGNWGTGHGWTGTQTCFYNCVAPKFLVDAPPGGIAWVIGSAPKDVENMRVAPNSLFYQQVQDRLGKAALYTLLAEDGLKHLGTYRWAEKRLKKRENQ
ncbi:MAG: hypothetical protein AB3N16_04635 [Flavobacteriaceae bacterium]